MVHAPVIQLARTDYPKPGIRSYLGAVRRARL